MDWDEQQRGTQWSWWTERPTHNTMYEKVFGYFADAAASIIVLFHADQFLGLEF